mmetsp:Transcript_29186/g.51030  ORF Transcript_29186/g.51030 Transcript_29186/m.51030 type:complete len:438 (+) Transcript_29186:56-1369(+)
MMALSRVLVLAASFLALVAQARLFGLQGSPAVASQLKSTSKGETEQKKTAESENADKQKQATSMMPIEDVLMGMTDSMKSAMTQEVTQHNGPVNQAINFVKSHPNSGWSHCADQAKTCWCNGKARFGSYNGGYPVFSGAVDVVGSIQCTAVSFHANFAATKAGLHCQCSDVSEKTWQTARLRFNSVSYLQEAWIMLTRVLGQAKLLPTNGEKTWQGEMLFATRGSGSHDRTFMDIFLAETAHLISATPKTCLEWAPLTYMSRFPACQHGKQLSLDYEPDINKMYVEGNGKVHCDNVHLGKCLGNTKLDIAISTNVWEHEVEPFAAMQSLYDVMNWGGIMLFTVPFVAPFHGVPYDFYRYTKSGVVHLLEKAGWCVPRSLMASGGDFINDVALFAGVGPGDFSETEIQQAYHRGYDNIPDGALVVMAVAFKTNAPCMH